MKRITIGIITGLITLLFLSCEKNELKDLELRDNIYEHQIGLPALVVDSIKDTKNGSTCRVYAWTSLKNDYLSHPDMNYNVVVYRNGEERMVLSGGKFSLVDLNVSCWTNYTYEFSIRYEEGFETEKTNPVTIYTN